MDNFYNADPDTLERLARQVEDIASAVSIARDAVAQADTGSYVSYGLLAGALLKPGLELLSAGTDEVLDSVHGYGQACADNVRAARNDYGEADDNIRRTLKELQ